MKLVRWDAIQELVAMTDRLNRTVNDDNMPRAEDYVGAFAPPVDKEDLDVRPETGVLTLLDMYTPETDVEVRVPKARRATS